MDGSCGPNKIILDNTSACGILSISLLKEASLSSLGQSIFKLAFVVHAGKAHIIKYFVL